MVGGTSVNSPARRIATADDYQVETIKTGRWKENSYVVQHVASREIALIDPGNDADAIFESIEHMDGIPKLVLLTHAHFDHVGALDAVCTRYGLPFYIHSGDHRLLQRATLYAMSFERQVVTIPEGYQPLETSTPAWSGDPVEFIHTPGHTDGGVCYYWDGICFSGDTLLNKLVGRSDLPGSSGEGLKKSVGKLLDSLPPDTLLFPGHGGTWTVADARSWWKNHSEAPPQYAMEGAFK
jgi:hydroxyacylglutathione hydrolase